MLPFLIGLVLHGGFQTENPLRDRLNEIQSGWSWGQVVKLLGQPDYTRRPTSSWTPPDPEIQDLCYGPLSKDDKPTLGSVFMKDHVVASVYVGPGERPPRSILGEAELKAATKRLEEISERESGQENPRDLIEAANLLIGKGQNKALAILDEYSAHKSGLWLYWLVRVAFTSQLPNGVFEIPPVGQIHPFPPQDLRTWPTCPVEVVDDVPFIVYSGIAIAGAPGRFRSYLYEHQSDWAIRRALLSPPTDPFPAAEKLFKMAMWPFDASGPFGDDCWCGGKALMLHQVLNLVDTAFAPDNAKAIGSPGAEVSASSFQNFHKQFLGQACHWDATRQKYVRRDGSVLSD